MNRLTRLRQQLSDRLWAEDDAFARQAGWTITKTRGRFGLQGRVYRDPRFSQRRARATTTARPAKAPAARACDDTGARRPSRQAGPDWKQALK